MSNKTAESMNERLVSCFPCCLSSCCCAHDASLSVVRLSSLSCSPARSRERMVAQLKHNASARTCDWAGPGAWRKRTGPGFVDAPRRATTGIAPPSLCGDGCGGANIYGRRLFRQVCGFADAGLATCLCRLLPKLSALRSRRNNSRRLDR